MLAERVRAGALPPVQQRLPHQPAVVEPVRQIGRYGGAWRRLAKEPNDMGLNSILGYEPLLRWGRDGVSVLPGVAERWEMNEDATEFTFHLRPGMRWSDGHPFTSADFAFTHEHIECNEQLTVIHAPWKIIGGRLMELETPDPHTVVIRFASSYGLFPQVLAYRGLQRALFQPRHYLEQFHAAFVERATLDREARRRGFVDWRGYFHDRGDLNRNPQLPTVNPFVCAVPMPSPRCSSVRNPYYWKVDPEGNQLPYIDEITYATVFDGTVLNLKAINGEVDFQHSKLDLANYVQFVMGRDQATDPANRYRVGLADSASATAVYVNQHSQNEELRPILQDRRFRIALSVALDRSELIEIFFFGLAEPSNGSCSPAAPFYIDGNDALHTQYDPELANNLLDELGLRRGADGRRRLPDGKPFRQILHVPYHGEPTEMWMLVADYWREVGLDFIVKEEDTALSVMQVRGGLSDFWAYATAERHWEIDGWWRVPLSPASYYAPLYGRYYQSGGKTGVKPPPAHQQLVDWHHELKATPRAERREELGRRILHQWAEQCYVIGICRKRNLYIVSNRFRNVPEPFLPDYSLMSPGYIGIEQFWIDDPDA